MALPNVLAYHERSNWHIIRLGWDAMGSTHSNFLTIARSGISSISIR